MDYVLEKPKNTQAVRTIWYAFALCVMLVVCINSQVCYADTGSNLVDWFSTKSFHGTSEVFSKMNFIGKIMAYTISIFGLLGLFTVGMRVMLTLLYLSGKSFWDNIDEIKSAGKGQKFFGMGALAKDSFNAQHGVGLDAFVSFFLSLFPNIKAYSEYATGRNHTMNLSEDDTVTTYLLKSALPNIMIIFAFTMAFNGTLWQAYGTVVNGMAVVADTFVSTRLDEIVSNALNTGSNYSFGFSGDDTEYGSFKQKVAKDVYNKVLSKCTDVSTVTKQTVGKSVEENVGPLIDALSLQALGYGTEVDSSTGQAQVEAIISSYKTNKSTNIGESNVTWLENNIKSHMTDQQAKNLQYSVVINTTESYSNAITFNSSSLGLVTDKEDTYYVHLFISKKANSDETNYFDAVEDTNALDSESKKTGNSLETAGDKNPQ